MAEQISCPYCKKDFYLQDGLMSTLICPSCKNIFRVRGKKTYKNEEVAPEVLCHDYNIVVVLKFTEVR